ncbi:MAG: DNA polymerase III subunit delta [Candidatus Pacebacteria bacterium]|nr:DNA polymerase III subunit delta [Candidatus Paceibacterota bacterium]
MIYFLYGPDTFRLIKKLNEIKEQYALQHGSFLVVKRVDLQEESEGACWDFLNQANLFVSQKLLIIENSFFSQSFKKEILKNITSLSQGQDILVFLEYKDIKSNDPFFLALKEKGKAQLFTSLSGVKLKNWVQDCFKQLDSYINEEAQKKLLEYTNSQTWALSNEIRKLSAFSSSITSKEIELLVRPKPEAEIFKTIDSFFANSKKAALKELQKHLDIGESPFYLLSMLSYQIRNLLVVKIATERQDLTFQELGIHPFVFKKLTALSRSFSLVKLKGIFQNIFWTELQIKTGQNSPENALRQLLVMV